MLSLLLCPSVLLGLGEKFWLLEHKFYWADSPLPYEGLGSKVIHLPPVEHLKTVWGFFLIICVNLFPGYQICRHITSQEKEVSSTLALSMVFLTRASSKEATITVFQALQSLLCLMQSCKHPLLRPFHIRARFFFFSSLCLSYFRFFFVFPGSSDYSDGMLLGVSDTGAACRHLLMNESVAVGQAQHARPRSSLPLRVRSAVLWYLAPHWKDLCLVSCE